MSLDYKNITQQTYNKNAQFFSAKFEKPFSLRTQKEITFFINNSPGNKILDAGCGSGIFSQYFLEKGLDVIGIDNSDEMIKLTKNRGINAINMDLENIVFLPKSFNGIWAMSSLLHVPKKNMRCVLESFHKILSDNGILHVTLKKGTGEKIIQDSPQISRFFSFWTIEEFLQITKDLFETIESGEDIVNEKAFIRMTFRKKKLRP